MSEDDSFMDDKGRRQSWLSSAPAQSHFSLGHKTISVNDAIRTELGDKIAELQTPDGQIDITKLEPRDILELDRKGLIELTNAERSDLLKMVAKGETFERASPQGSERPHTLSFRSWNNQSLEDEKRSLSQDGPFGSKSYFKGKSVPDDDELRAVLGPEGQRYIKDGKIQLD